MPQIDHVEWYERKKDIPYLTKEDVPDCLFPSNNEFGIPLLRMDCMGNAVDLPVVLWGQRRRTDYMFGTWAFYVDDYRFKALWSDPTPVVNSGAMNAFECNFSLHPQLPKAIAIYYTYQKRWISRFWQEFGRTRIFVDLNVDPLFREVNMLGVPNGWTAYATHGYSDRLHTLDEERRFAYEWAGHAKREDVVFVVYGGGGEVKEYCQSHGLIWIPEQSDVQRKKKIVQGTIHEGAPHPIDMVFEVNGAESFTARRTPKKNRKIRQTALNLD